MKFTSSYIAESIEILNQIDLNKIEGIISEISKLRSKFDPPQLKLGVSNLTYNFRNLKIGVKI